MAQETWARPEGVPQHGEQIYSVFQSSVGAFGWRVERGASRGPNFRMGGPIFCFWGGSTPPKPPRFPQMAPRTGPCLSDRGPNDFRRK